MSNARRTSLAFTVFLPECFAIFTDASAICWAMSLISCASRSAPWALILCAPMSVSIRSIGATGIAVALLRGMRVIHRSWFIWLSLSCF